ncbi:hypothetical protein FQA39_LY11846 [Lamprigera yunnana]|nr:hypothetical protein FQA39_LY11846 [Lamprigera yunnana]
MADDLRNLIRRREPAKEFVISIYEKFANEEVINDQNLCELKLIADNIKEFTDIQNQIELESDDGDLETPYTKRDTFTDNFMSCLPNDSLQVSGHNLGINLPTINLTKISHTTHSIKTKTRARLDIFTLDTLVRLKLLTVPYDKFDYSNAYKLWTKNSIRGRYNIGQECKMLPLQ